MHAQEIIDLLGLEPLPLEGGYYKETLKSEEILSKENLPGRYKQDKPYYTCIYYLVTPETFSSLHRLPTDEIFHFYLGDPVEMLLLSEDGSGELLTLGTDLVRGERPQICVPKYTWQGSKLKPGGNFALLGTTMSPGFGFEDFEGPNKETLISQYPEFKEKILGL